MKGRKKCLMLNSILVVGIFINLVTITQAQTGNIDDTNKWAWGTNIGWVNFKPTEGGVTVYLDHLEGYAYAESIGWISLGTHTGGYPHTYSNDAEDNYGVNRHVSGYLYGYAWSSNTGWINFNPANGGVSIDETDCTFDGYAWGENVGWIHFKNTEANGYNVAYVNAIPVLDDIETTDLEFTEGDEPKVITNTITATDSDDINIESAVIQITGNYQNGEDILEFANTASITGTWDASNGKMTLTGSETLVNYEAALKTVKYKNTLDNPTASIQNGTQPVKVRSITATPRTVSFTVYDGNDDSLAETRTIVINPVNDDPYVLRNNGAEVNTGGTVIITSNMLKCGDPDATTYFVYTLVSAPSNGELQNNGSTLPRGGTFTQTDINGGKVSYTHNGTETTSDSFTFEVADNQNATAPTGSFAITINPTNNPPGQPTHVVYSYDEDGNVVITWYDNSGNEIGFYVRRQRNTTAKLNIVYEYELIATLPADTEEFVDENIEEGASYTYQVTSFNDNGESEVAAGDDGGETAATAPLTTPTNLQATANGDGSITIVWEDNSSLETSYAVERSTNEDWSEIYTAGNNATSYTDASVENGTTYYYRVKAVNDETESVYSNQCQATCMVTDVEDWANGTPTEFTLNQNYPNPFNPSTTIRYGIPAVGTHHDVSVRLVVYNMLGQQVTTLVDQMMSAGYHEVTFDASGINSGIYLYKLEAGNFIEIKKMIFMK